MEIPRRAQMQKWVPAEKAIWDAMQAVEHMGCSPALTEAVTLLGKAHDKVADHVEAVPADQPASIAAPAGDQSRTKHIFAGKPDDRQAATDIAVSRFRPRYRALSDDEKSLHDQIKAKAEELEQLINRVPPGRYTALAMTELELSIMWAVKGLTS